MSETNGVHYEPIAVSAESTVVAEFLVEDSTDTAYQSEAELEREFIKLLGTQAYEYIDINSEAQLTANLRLQLELLNAITFSDDEWARFFSESIAGANEGIVDKTVRIQDDYVQALKRDDGTTKNSIRCDGSRERAPASSYRAETTRR
jgi:type I restriction enzyme R subunit